jgi:hypothetical protein
MVFLPFSTGVEAAELQAVCAASDNRRMPASIQFVHFFIVYYSF